MINHGVYYFFETKNKRISTASKQNLGSDGFLSKKLRVFGFSFSLKKCVKQCFCPKPMGFIYRKSPSPNLIRNKFKTLRINFYVVHTGLEKL